jgi:hypothetical protein
MKEMFMATINYIADVNLLARQVKVVWQDLAVGDDGQAFDASGFALASMHAWGGSGEIRLQLSNEITPSNWLNYDSVNPVPGAREYARRDRWGWIRPFHESGSGTTSMSVIFVIPDAPL